MNDLLNGRSILDLKLLLEELVLFDWLFLSIGGLVIGLLVAHSYWLRTYQRLRKENLLLLAASAERVVCPLAIPPEKPSRPKIQAIAKNIFIDESDAGENRERRRVVFTMDVSRSLSDAQFRESKSALKKALDKLSDGDLYQVIFFSGAAWFAHQRMIKGGEQSESVTIRDDDTEMTWNSEFDGFHYEGGNHNLPGGHWREKNDQNIKATKKDIDAVGKSYGTSWHLPFMLAMNLDPVPKTIFFLTDGSKKDSRLIAEGIVDMVKRHGDKTKVNTIAVQQLEASRPLHHIARETGGKFSLVVGKGKVLEDEDLIKHLAIKNISLSV